jgi:hypothetical protein
VANAGVVLPAVIAGRLGLEALTDQSVDLGDRPGAANPGAQSDDVAVCDGARADWIDDCDVLALRPDASDVGCILMFTSVGADQVIDTLTWTGSGSLGR